MTAPDDLDPKQKALAALALAAEVFLMVTLDEIDKTHPGRARDDLDLIESGKAHVLISIQTNRRELRAALALVSPDFKDVLTDYEMRLVGPIAAAFAEREKVAVTNLQKLN